MNPIFNETFAEILVHYRNIYCNYMDTLPTNQDQKYLYHGILVDDLYEAQTRH